MTFGAFSVRLPALRALRALQRGQRDMVQLVQHQKSAIGPQHAYSFFNLYGDLRGIVSVLLEPFGSSEYPDRLGYERAAIGGVLQGGPI